MRLFCFIIMALFGSSAIRAQAPDSGLAFVKEGKESRSKIDQDFLSKISRFCLMFVIITGVFSCKSLEDKQDNSQYDIITRKNVYLFVEELPKYKGSEVYKGGEVEFTKELFNNIHHVFSENDYLQTRLMLQFVIDKKGHLIGARILGKESDALSDYEKAVLKALYLTKDWQAGRQNGKPVNVLITMPINIHLNYN